MNSHLPARATTADTGATLEARRWRKALARYGHPDPGRSLLELGLTLAPFLLLWASALFCLDYGYGLSLLLAVPAAAFLVRLFMIQHDCSHGSFFRRRGANDVLGRLLGVLNLVPYDYWRRTHAVHHATLGDLDRRGMGDVGLLTVAEYRALSLWRRLAYRLSRNQAVLLLFAPFYLFVLKYRLPFGLMRGGRKVWIGTMATNLAIVGLVVGMAAWLGLGRFLLVQVPITLIAGSIGVWIFYIQHQFEDTYWERRGEWSFHAGALYGSTHYDLPAPLRWLTANIGVHHVHHLASRIPSYRLREVLKDHPELREVGRLTLRQSLRCFQLSLWDEDTRKLVGFRELRGTAAA
jgi:omega-6 fatty acid desaturase (delta-12 desaturase)